MRVCCCCCRFYRYVDVDVGGRENGNRFLLVSFQTVSMAIAENLSQVEGLACLLQSSSTMSFSKWP